MKRILIMLAIVLLTIAASYMGYRTGLDRGFERGATSPPTTELNPLSPPAKPEPIVLESARDLIEHCRAEGIYRLHNNETGLLMKGGLFQPVKDATEETLRTMQNPECPFTRSTIE